MMAVDVMHLSAMANGSPAHVSYSPSPSRKSASVGSRPQQELSRSAQDLSSSSFPVTNLAHSPSRSSAGGDSLTGSELSWTGTAEEQQAVEQIQQNRRLLKEEIDVS